MPRILAAREARGAVFSDKPSSTIMDNELSNSGELANSTERDAADMRKMGVKQETKVRLRIPLCQLGRCRSTWS